MEYTPEIAKKYDGVSDFFRNATTEEIHAVLREAARMANEEQLKVYEQAKLINKDI